MNLREVPTQDLIQELKDREIADRILSKLSGDGGVFYMLKFAASMHPHFAGKYYPYGSDFIRAKKFNSIGAAKAMITRRRRDDVELELYKCTMYGHNIERIDYPPQK